MAGNNTETNGSGGPPKDIGGNGAGSLGKRDGPKVTYKEPLTVPMDRPDRTPHRAVK